MYRTIPNKTDLTEVRRWMWDHVDLFPTDVDRLVALYHIDHPLDDEIEAKIDTAAGKVDAARYVATEIQEHFARGWRIKTDAKKGSV